MINEYTRGHLLTRLPLIYDRVKKEDFDMIMFKWGNEDNKYHSIKAVISKLKLKKTEKEIKDIENNAVSLIESTISEIFQCVHCGIDLRKCGVQSTISGIQRCHMFIAADGSITRENHKEFNTKEDSVYTFKCDNCKKEISKNMPAHLFMGNTINTNTVTKYLQIYRKIRAENIPNLKYSGGVDIDGMPMSFGSFNETLRRVNQQVMNGQRVRMTDTITAPFVFEE